VNNPLDIVNMVKKLQDLVNFVNGSQYLLTVSFPAV